MGAGLSSLIPRGGQRARRQSGAEQHNAAEGGEHADALYRA